MICSFLVTVWNNYLSNPQNYFTAFFVIASKEEYHYSHTFNNLIFNNSNRLHLTDDDSYQYYVSDITLILHLSLLISVWSIGYTI